MTPSGDRPVPDNELILVTFRDGHVEEIPAWAIDWGCRGNSDDVVDWALVDKGAPRKDRLPVAAMCIGIAFALVSIGAAGLVVTLL